MVRSIVLFEDVIAVIYWQQLFIQDIHVTIRVQPIRALMKILVPSSFMAPYTITLPPTNFIDLAVYLLWNLVPFGRLTYSLLPNNSTRHSSLNMMSFHNKGSTLEYALHQLRRLRICTHLFKNGFLAAIRPSSPYFLRILLTVDIEVGFS